MRKAHAELARVKLSTTVSRKTYEFLRAMVSSGQVGSIAEAVDMAVGKVRRAENRKALAAATACYFDGISPETIAEENALGRDMPSAGSGIDFDSEI